MDMNCAPIFGGLKVPSKMRGKMFNSSRVSPDLDIAYHSLVKYYMFMYRRLNPIHETHPDVIMQRVFDRIWQELSDN